MLNGFESAELPFVLGYVMTQARPTAKVLLATELGDPLLATNRFGLGQTFAYSSDLTEKWGSEWLTWSSCGSFWNQVIRSILRKEDGRGIQLKSTVSADELTLNLTRNDDAGNLINRVQWSAESLDKLGKVSPVTFSQTGIGSYSAKLSLVGKERLVVQIRDEADGKNKTFYWQRDYPAEFQLNNEEDPALLDVQQVSMNDVRVSSSNSVVEKDRLPWFVFSALVLAILGIVLRRV